MGDLLGPRAAFSPHRGTSSATMAIFEGEFTGQGSGSFFDDGAAIYKGSDASGRRVHGMSAAEQACEKGV